MNIHVNIQDFQSWSDEYLWDYLKMEKNAGHLEFSLKKFLVFRHGKIHFLMENKENGVWIIFLNFS